MVDQPPHDSAFERLAAGDSGADLVDVMLDIAADGCPALDRQACRAELERLTSLARARLGDAAAEPLRRRLERVSDLLYRQERFTGNSTEYHDPRNSYLNEVLARRRGIPITLAVVYIAVARGAGVPAFGVPTPGHFVVGCTQNGETWYVDPFVDGDVLSQEACRHRIERFTGHRGSVLPEHFRPASVRDIAVRVLRNLKVCLALEDRWQELITVERRLVKLVDEPSERRDLGLMYLRVGDPVRALPLLEKYVETCGPEQAEELAPYLRTARRLLAELN